MMKRSSLWTVLAIAIALAGIKALFVMTTPLKEMAMNAWVPDDTFIIMNVSKNIAAGKGFSFDGIHPTTGSVFLWTYFASLSFFIFPKLIAAKAVFLLSILFGSAAAVMAYLLSREYTKSTLAQWIAFLLSSCTANAFLNPMNGMETGMFTFFVLCGAYFFTLSMKKDNPRRYAIMTGIFVGLSVLTRADAIFLMGAIGLTQLILLRDARNKKEMLMRLGLIIRTILPFVACLAILLLWNMGQTDSLLPANQGGRRAIAMMAQNFSFEEFSLVHYLQIVGWNTFNLEELVGIALGSSALGILSLLFAVTKKESKEIAWMTSFYALSFFGMLVAYQWYFGGTHGLRYINPVMILLFVFISDLLTSIPFGKFAKTAAVTMTVFIIGFSWQLYRDFMGRMPWSEFANMHISQSPNTFARFWAPIEWMSTELPKDAVVAARDHGRLSFFSELPVQDLAGIIDPRVLKELKEGTLGAYLLEQNVRYLYVLSPEQRPDQLHTALQEQLETKEMMELPRGYEGHLYEVLGAR